MSMILLKGNIKRIKGLGQLNEHDLKFSMFSTVGDQRLDKIIYSPEGVEQLCKLMGPKIEPRKEFVFSKSSLKLRPCSVVTYTSGDSHVQVGRVGEGLDTSVPLEENVKLCEELLWTRMCMQPSWLRL